MKQEFFNLRNPEQENAGMHKGMWYVRVEAKDWPSGGALMNNANCTVGQIGFTEENNAIYYFDSEEDALHAIEAYYSCHGVMRFD